MAVKVELVKQTKEEYLLYVDGEGLFGFHEYVRRYLASLTNAGYTDEVKELIESFGVNKLSEIPVEFYIEFTVKCLNCTMKKAED